MEDRIRSVANEAVLGLLFVSLLVIYLIVPQSTLVTFLCVITLAVSLIVAMTGEWSDLGVLALFAGLVSLVAAYFVGRSLRFGTISSVIIPLLWLGVLSLVYRWVMRRMIRVPDDRAFVVRNMFSRKVTVAPKPVVLPLVEPVIATIPLYKLSQQVDVEKINTRTGFNVDLIRARIGYQIIDPLALLANLRNKEGEQSRLAKERNQNLGAARNDPTFWEALLERELDHEVDDIIRQVIFETDVNVIDTYNQRREELAADVEQRLKERMRPWGVRINRLEFEYVELDPARWQAFYKERIRAGEVIDAEHYAKLEAQRVKRVLESEVEAEAQRVASIIKALRDAGIEITPDLVVRAIRATSDWVMESDYTLLPSAPPAALPSQPAPKPAGDKKDNGAKKP